MKLKKLNAILTLPAAFIVLEHLVFTSVTLIKGQYEPTPLPVLLILFVTVSGHALLSLVILFFRHDGSDLLTYPKQNARTILQRVTALLIALSIHLHIPGCRKMMHGELSGGIGETLFCAGNLLFYFSILLHIAFSFSKALITLGWVRTDKGARKADRAIGAVCILFGLLCVAALVIYIVKH